jgi:hypothetical protein
MDCPSFQALVEFVDGLAPDAERRAVERHLADGCVPRAAAVDWYASVRAAAREDRSEEPPSWLTERTVAAIHDARTAAEQRGLHGFLAQIQAALVADSLSPEPTYARGPGDGRQLLYAAAPFDVDLLVAEVGGGDRLRVAGQVLADDDDSFEEVSRLVVELERNGKVAVVAETSAIGEFEFDDLAPGLYDIHILGEWREIILVNVPLALE